MLSFTINNRHYKYRVARNGILNKDENQQRAHYPQSSNFMRTLESNYSQVLEEKQEKIRLEKIRQEKIRRGKNKH